jgi:hypothetical protein
MTGRKQKAKARSVVFTSQPTNGHVTNIVRLGYVHQGLTGLLASQCFLSLMLGQFMLPSELNSIRFSSDPPFIGSRQDQVPFELR